MALKLVGSYLCERSAKLVASSCFTRRLSSSAAACRSASQMRFVQFQRKDDKCQRLGTLSEDGTKLKELANGPNDFISFIRQHSSLQDIENELRNVVEEDACAAHVLLPAVTNPEKIICIGLNYKCHCEEQNKPAPTEPMFFSKFNSTLVGPNSGVVAHKIARRLDWEAELAVVIGKEAKHVPLEQAMDYVFGYSVAQDITARDWQRRNGGQFLIGKSMDTFLPLGPAVVHKSLVQDVYNLNLRTSVNGVEKQNGNTGDMIFKIDDVIHRLTQFMTLKPGDIILTGTPKGVGTYRKPPEFLKVGDVIETHIQGLGKMVNTMVAP